VLAGTPKCVPRTVSIPAKRPQAGEQLRKQIFLSS
jgi:hypothetical protein